ncbi:Carbonic anhydrase [Granulibacter bethesdensis]|uniref:Carbonic anhydrase n=2 Tax=Granulibacter bethesdensis TaxID=364410 RepID=A0AAC9P9N5_9PROT|nr:Carbonic anhydrase [Granulibacter bethesdensis]APH62806.1 Carbonic anhydrase [Granulibacter bethesdensis]
MGRPGGRFLLRRIVQDSTGDRPMDTFISGMARFRGEVFPQNRALYEKLAREGQQPKALMISCADSRVIPEMIAQCGPGELFVSRNVGNIVPPYVDESSLSGEVGSAIEYAVAVLGVSDIVVCGHSDCGAMKAIMNPSALEPLPHVKSWLRHGCGDHQRLCEGLPSTETGGDPVRTLAMRNVALQLNNLRSYPVVREAVAHGRLRLHGWVFNIESGGVYALDGETGRYHEVMDHRLPVAIHAANEDAASIIPMAAE